MANQPSQGAIPRAGGAAGLPAGGPGAGQDFNPELRRPNNVIQPLGLQGPNDPRDHYGVRERLEVNNMSLWTCRESHFF